MAYSVDMCISYFAKKIYTKDADPRLDFQNSIQQGDVNRVAQQITKRQSVNDPLPNGELPLHFAIREGQEEVAKCLLSNGADPISKDFQGLTAIDHAVFLKNEKIFALVLGHKIRKDVQGLLGQVQSQASISYVKGLKKKIQSFSKVDVSDLTPLCKMAYEGDCRWLRYSLEELRALDKKGLSPIHYAVLGKKKEPLYPI